MPSSGRRKSSSAVIDRGSTATRTPLPRSYHAGFGRRSLGLSTHTSSADPGAERTIISRAVAERLNLNLSAPMRFEVLTGVGQSPPVPVVRLNRVQVGASIVSGLEASVLDLPPIIRADGLLGLNFLRRF